MGKKIREDQVDFIQKIKSFLHPPLIPTEIGIESSATKFDKIMEKMEKIEEILEKSKRPEGARKKKIKGQIISLLKEHKKLDSYQLHDLIKLSRTRCNEYFRELTREGITEGVIIGRKKYYRLVRK